MRMRTSAGAIALAMGLAACGGGTSGDGDRAYYDGAASAALGAATNDATCATCHSVDGASDSGDSLRDIAYRSSFKGGGAPTLLAATNACVTGWMGGEALTATDPEWLALERFLQSISSTSVTAPNTLAPEVLADEAAYEAAYAGGDATRGAALFAARCGDCHGDALTVGAASSPPLSVLRAYSVGRIAQQVRTSGPPPSGTGDPSDTTPGPMPFFEPDELSATDLRDIIAHVRGS